jgi:hypothetical protein
MQPRASSRRITIWLAILGYTLVASGLPLPFGIVAPSAQDSPAAKRLAGKDRSRPFPCMDKPCGCATAEQCFTNCCCHTLAERLAWAKARGLEPAVLAALARRVAVASPAPAAAGCCAVKQQAKPSCCASTDDGEGAEDSVCGDSTSLAGEPVSPPSSDEPAPNDEPAPDDEPGCKVVILRAMLACGGIVAQWAAVGVSLPPPGIVTCELPWPSIGTVVIRDEQASDGGGPPDLPPPRA